MFDVELPVAGADTPILDQGEAQMPEDWTLLNGMLKPGESKMLQGCSVTRMKTGN